MSVATKMRQLAGDALGRFVQLAAAAPSEGDLDKLAELYRSILAGACGAATHGGKPVLARTAQARLGELIDDWLKLAKAAQQCGAEAVQLAGEIMALDGGPDAPEPPAAELAPDLAAATMSVNFVDAPAPKPVKAKRR